MEYLIVGLVLLAVLVLLGIGLVTSRQRRRLTGAATPDAPRARRRRRRPAERAGHPPAARGAGHPLGPAACPARPFRLDPRHRAADPALPGEPRPGHLGRGRGDPAARPTSASTPTAQLVDRLRTRVRVDGVKDPAAVRALLREELLALVDPTLDRILHLTSADGPAVALVVGVNGTGKTTTTGKLSRLLVAEGQTVLLGAADTFRAAAAEQLADLGRSGRRRGGARRRGRRPGERRVRSRPAGRRAPASTSSSSTRPAGCTPRPA